MELKQGQRVSFNNRHSSGIGVIKAIRSTSKGDFYVLDVDVEASSTKKKQISLRRSQICKA